jgi:hypothetical protein
MLENILGQRVNSMHEYATNIRESTKIVHSNTGNKYEYTQTHHKQRQRKLAVDSSVE